MINQTYTVNCACVIHGDAYQWTYVQKLYAMLCRNLTFPVKLHVFTEEEREVPDPFIKHTLDTWPGIAGPKSAWWYKIQMFNPDHFSGQLLYFDLDVVITGNIDWMLQAPPSHFSTIRDFRYLQRPAWAGINSSVMLWDTTRFSNVWESFMSQGPSTVTARYPGDQDFLSAVIDERHRNLFDADMIQSWRWQMNDGGQNMKTRKYHSPGTGCRIDPKVRVIVFHGTPKPHEVQDKYILQHWRL
jgi:hypothetical protein